MRCNICDRQLSEKEIIFSKELDTFEPCTTCLDAAMEAAYTAGFDTEDDEYILIEDNDNYVEPDLVLSYKDTENYDE